MKIWHVGASASPEGVNGLNASIWLLGKEQAKLGHKVTLILEDLPDKLANLWARDHNLELVHVKSSQYFYDMETLEALMHSEPPSLVHMHNVFLPNQAVLAQKLHSKRIPYIITPHGGLNFERSKIKKYAFGFLLEKSRFFRASAIVVVSPKEEVRIRKYVPKYKNIIRWIPYSFDVSSIEVQEWRAKVDLKRVVFLGRFDVLHKGIDVLAKIAHLTPSVEFHLYGKEESKTRKQLIYIRKHCPNNLFFHDPVYDGEKFEILADASLYIQTSRWEGFPISIVEAMHVGIPCAISEQPDFASLFREYDLGLLLSKNPRAASKQILEALENSSLLKKMSRNSKQFANLYFNPVEVAKRYIDLYTEVIDQRAATLKV